MRSCIAVAGAALAAALCPDLASLRSPAVQTSWNPAHVTGVWFENRYTDLAQIGASCQQMNKKVAADGISISEDYRVLYGGVGGVPFDLPLIYNASGLPLGVSQRSLAGLTIASFPSVVVDFTTAADGSYDTLTEYLCWEVPILGFDYVEVRLSTRAAVPAPGVLDAMQARAVALGVTWTGNLTAVSFAGCPAWNPNNATAAPAPVVTAPSPLERAWSRIATAADPVAHASWVSEEARAAAAAAVAAAAPAGGPAVVAGATPSLTVLPSGATPPACDPTANGTDLLLPGLYPGKPQLAFVFIQGATVAPACYAPFLAALQASVTDFNVIVGAPASPILNTPNPLTIGEDIARIVSIMERVGGVNNRTAVWAYGAHSLGGQMLQLFLANNTIPGAHPAALALYGSYITRQYRSPNDSVPAYPVPVLSMAGELDGLARVSRFAEAYWHQQVAADPANHNAYPVFIVPGMTHGQFCSFNGTAPGIISIFDLQPEVDTPTAQAEAAALTAAFLQGILGNNATAVAAVEAAQAETGAFLAPLLSALEYEAYYNLLPPCYDNPPSPACNVGCPFSITAQQAMSNNGSFPFGVNVTDAMHPVDDITPIHLPNITNNCTAPTSSCVLNTSTVTENTYDALFSTFDVALYPVTAHETRIKLTSRQNAQFHAGIPDPDFNTTDQLPNLCADINAATLAWAVAHAGAATAARYAAKGLPIVQIADTDAYIGPQFTYGSLNYTFVNATASATGAPYVAMGSTTLRTPLNYFLPISAGFHYCLLLSPARAMEWVYVDSLRPFLLD